MDRPGRSCLQAGTRRLLSSRCCFAALRAESPARALWGGPVLPPFSSLPFVTSSLRGRGSWSPDVLGPTRTVSQGTCGRCRGHKTASAGTPGSKFRIKGVEIGWGSSRARRAQGGQRAWTVAACHGGVRAHSSRAQQREIRFPDNDSAAGKAFPSVTFCMETEVPPRPSNRCASAFSKFTATAKAAHGGGRGRAGSEPTASVQRPLVLTSEFKLRRAEGVGATCPPPGPWGPVSLSVPACPLLSLPPAAPPRIHLTL